MASAPEPMTMELLNLVSGTMGRLYIVVYRLCMDGNSRIQVPRAAEIGSRIKAMKLKKNAETNAAPAWILNSRISKKMMTVCREKAGDIPSTNPAATPHAI